MSMRSDFIWLPTFLKISQFFVRQKTYMYGKTWLWVHFWVKKLFELVWVVRIFTLFKIYYLFWSWDARNYFNIRKITHLYLKSHRPIFSSHRSLLNLWETSIFSNFIWISSRPAAVVLSGVISLQFSTLAHVLWGVCFLWCKREHKLIRSRSPCNTLPGNRINQRAACLVGDDGLTANEK